MEERNVEGIMVDAMFRRRVEKCGMRLKDRILAAVHETDYIR